MSGLNSDEFRENVGFSRGEFGGNIDYCWKSLKTMMIFCLNEASFLFEELLAQPMAISCIKISFVEVRWDINEKKFYYRRIFACKGGIWLNLRVSNVEFLKVHLRKLFHKWCSLLSIYFIKTIGGNIRRKIIEKESFL
jgi:hypothetical protein